MAVWSPLTTNFAVNMQDCAPRTADVDSIIHHHAASNNKLATLALFAPGGREVTPNYFIAGREIWGIVPEDYRAFTSGSWIDDNRGITYEILNSTNGPNWEFDSATLDTVMRLDADIARRHGVRLVHALPGFLEHRNINEWTGRGYATACAGPSFNINSIIAGTAQRMSPTKKRKNTMSTIFHRIDNGKYTYALAGESPGTSANWLETQDPNFANKLAETHGNSKLLSSGTWDSWKARYLEPLKIAGTVGGGGSAGSAPSAAEVAKAVNDDAARRLSQ